MTEKYELRKSYLIVYLGVATIHRGQVEKITMRNAKIHYRVEKKPFFRYFVSVQVIKANSVCFWGSSDLPLEFLSFEDLVYKTGRSSNGRTHPSEGCYLGSSPSLPVLQVRKTNNCERDRVVALATLYLGKV